MAAKDANNGKMVVKDATNNKMKGLLKGLRYISQIFDENKDQEMQIGLPTDVKHVAHIGWDGPSTASSPSWMNEFQAPPGFEQSPPLGNGETKEDSRVKWVSEDSSRKGSRGARSPGHDVPDLPKSSRRHSSNGHGVGGPDSPKRGKSDKPKQTRRSSKNKDTSDSSIRGIRQSTDPSQDSESPQNLPDIPKKTQRKKSKDSSFGGTSGSRRSKHHASSETCTSPGHQSATISQNSF
ncbi:hypothetical protein ACFX2I_004048 [Malus domestica]|nr:CRIB domain-containing protein RIC6 isoform X2 [Malus domestica]XP_028964791.1 CRIB domain-containing protein RIC6 isoform X2 [Malus domestica]XP_050105786.1 CRIB domain-containing protein RIC6-like isoform X2 [Malus sylvestris]XP_050105787.1 CRIB domain-containing protein RIC6-like isoform X2 [Malus sylvestris]